MKIGIVLPNQPAYSETFFNTKIKGLESHGYKVILFVNSKSSSCNYNTIKVAPNLSKGKLVNLGTSCKYLLQSVFFSFSATKKLYILNRKDKLSTINNIKNIIINGHILLEKVDWLHFGFGTMALARENVAQAIGAQMAVSFRGFDHYVFPIKNRNCYKKLFEKNVKYHVLSDEMKNDLLKLGIDTNKIFKITPAININFFQFEQKEKNEKSNCFQILTISRLHWIKGLNSILEALQIVKSKGINFHFTIIGDGNEKERLQFETYQLGLTENVTFVGKLNPIEIKNQLQNSDLYLQYSHQEGFCNSVIEAQAMRKICIVSNADGLVENVINNITGFVVPKRKPVHLANKILEVLMLSETEKNKITHQAIQRVNQHFTTETQIKQFIEFYEKI